MRPTLLLFCALCIILLAPRIRAQEDGEEASPTPPPAPQASPMKQQQDQQGDSSGQQDDQPQSSQEGSGESADASAGSMSLDDARVNMMTVVQAFLSARQIDGLWPLKSKSEKGRLLKLKLESREITKFRASGGTKYSGTLPFTDVKTGRPYDADFTVDMRGADWKVVSMKLAAGAKRKSKAKGKKADIEIALPASAPDADAPASGDAP